MKKRKVPQLVKDDPWLEPYQDEIADRIARYKGLTDKIKKEHKGLKNFSMAYKRLGIHYDKKLKGWTYREWAPEAYSLSLIGEFNNWDRQTHVLKKKEDGIWEIFIPGND